MKRRISAPAAVLLAIASLALAGCGGPTQIDLTSHSTLDLYYAGDPQAVINRHSIAPAAMDTSYGLHLSMLASAYLAMGDTDSAFAAIRKAYDIMNGYMSDQGGEPHFYKPESDKTFIGDPVEMSLNSWYVALLNFQRHDYSNCVAACKNAILADQPLKWEEQSEEDAKNNVVPKAKYVDDNGMLYLLEARGMMRAGGWSKDDIGNVVARGKEAFLRTPLFDPASAQAKVDGLFESVLDPKNNVIFVIDLGLCPKHTGIGEYRERIKINPVQYVDTNARLNIDGTQIPTERVCDVAYQKVFRGGRNFDETLNGRAQFKENAMEGGKTAAVVGVALMTSDNANARAIGAGVALVGLLFMGLSASTHPEADLRQWETLPGQVNMVCLPMKPGTYTVTCEGVDLHMTPLNVPRTCTRSFEVKAGSDTLVYLRPLPACKTPTAPPAPPPGQAADNAANTKQIQQSNDMGKDAFAKEKARKEAEDKAKKNQPSQPAPGPSSQAPAAPAEPPAPAPVTPKPEEPAGTWSTPPPAEPGTTTSPAPAPKPDGGGWSH